MMTLLVSLAAVAVTLFSFPAVAPAQSETPTAQATPTPAPPSAKPTPELGPGAEKPPLRRAGEKGYLYSETLSDRRTVTRWGHPTERVIVRSEPSTKSRRVGRLHLETEDKLPEVVLALESFITPDFQVWLKIEVPRKSGNITGWVREESITALKTVETHMTIDRKKLFATLRKRGKVIWRAAIGIGKKASPTPKGEFWIRERLRGLNRNPMYGPWAFGTSAYVDLSDWPGIPVVGLHGTDQPELVPGRPSNGCVRIRNPKILRLAKILPIGTPVTIN